MWRATKRKGFLFQRCNDLQPSLFIAHSDESCKSQSHHCSLTRFRIGGIRRTRSVRPANRQFIRQLARQFVRQRRFAGLTRWRRHLRARIARRDSGRWFARRARRRRRNVGRFDRHLARNRAVVSDRSARIIVRHGSLRSCFGRTITGRAPRCSGAPQSEFIQARGRPLRCCGRRDPARMRHSSWDGSARGCRARRCRVRRPRSQPCRRHPPLRDSWP